MISDWDEPETERAELGHLSAAWTDFAAASEARRIGVNRIQMMIAADHIPILDD